LSFIYFIGVELLLEDDDDNSSLNDPLFYKNGNSAALAYLIIEIFASSS
jgi:hypothetical protein